MFGGMSFATQSGATQNTPERQRRPEDRSNLLPVTVRLLESANEAAKTGDGELHFHGGETAPNILLLLAQVEAVHAQQKNMAEFTVCDGTGSLRVRFFATDGEAQEKALQSFSTGSWVKLFGQFRSAPTAHFSVSMLRPVKSADEISHHMIEVAHSALKCWQHNGYSGTDPSTPAPKIVKSGEPDRTSEPWTPEKPTAEAHMEVDMEAAKMPTESVVLLEGSALRSALLELMKVKAEEDDVGYSIPEVCSILEKKNKVTSAAVEKLMHDLVDEGELFNSTDDEHFSLLV
mmetsp:Transcript_3093/g.5399  ORF Transcript_3093/g.5399 Transcript_3093/m.5399 type:complete len:289 (-) Transcript_3093:140-1006(-)